MHNSIPKMNEKLKARITKWSSRTLSLVGMATIGYLGVSAAVGNGSALVEQEEATFAKRSSAFQVDPKDMPYEIKFEPSYLIENSNKMEKMFFHQQKQEKEFIKFQYPEDRFAPMEELGVVYLNGIKFYHQGESMLPYTEEEEELKLTRSARQTGEFCMDWKLAKGMDRYSDCTNHKTMASCKNLIMRVAN